MTSIFSIRGLWILNVRSTPTPEAIRRTVIVDAMPAVAHPHHEALEDLDALAVALDDLGADLDGVARRDLRQVGAELVLDDLVEHVHGWDPWCGRQPRLRVVSGLGTARRCAARPTAEDSTLPVACQPGGGSGPDLVEQLGLLAARLAAAVEEVRPSLEGPPQRLAEPPAADLLVVARDEDGRHGLAALERRGSRVLRVLEQAGRERLLGGRRLVDGAGQQPQDGVEDDERRRLAAGQHVVADRELEVDHARGPGRRRPRSAGTGRRGGGGSRGRGRWPAGRPSPPGRAGSPWSRVAAAPRAPPRRRRGAGPCRPRRRTCSRRPSDAVPRPQRRRSWTRTSARPCSRIRPGMLSHRGPRPSPGTA